MASIDRRPVNRPIPGMSNKDYGKVMALDLGERRIGVAISDATRTIASAHSVLNRRSRASDFERYAALIDEHKITLLVIGLPITLGGDEGQRATWVRDYAADLQTHVKVPIVFWDESLTTKEAMDALHAQGLHGKRLKERVDAVAATLILQSYLDSLRESPPYDE